MPAYTNLSRVVSVGLRVLSSGLAQAKASERAGQAPKPGRILRPHLALCFALFFWLSAALWAADTLDIYVVDVEGGKAVIVKNPSGQTMMIDGGVPARNGRDRDLGRVTAAAQAIGIKQFDVMLVTHYDVDHVGNIPAIYGKFPAKLLIDHGPLLPNPTLLMVNRRAADAYVAFLRGKKRLSVGPGDVIPFKDVKIDVVTSNEKQITKPLPGAGQPNTFCPAVLPEGKMIDDNSASIGMIWQFGKFRMADFGDLLQYTEMRLVCPDNKLGKVDVYMASNHGSSVSNSAALVHAIAPKVVVVNNGERKAYSPEVAKTFRSSPGIEDIWQAHYSNPAGADLNAPENLIANMKEQDCQGFSIKISARRDGSFTVTNLRNDFSKTYKK